MAYNMCKNIIHILVYFICISRRKNVRQSVQKYIGLTVLKIYSYIYSNDKRIIDLNIILKTIKLLEKFQGLYLCKEFIHLV